MRLLLLLAVLGQWAVGQVSGKPSFREIPAQDLPSKTQPAFKDLQVNGTPTLVVGSTPTYAVASDNAGILLTCTGTGQFPTVTWTKCEMKPGVTIEQIVQTISDAEWDQQKEWREDRGRLTAGWAKASQVATANLQGWRKCAANEVLAVGTPSNAGTGAGTLDLTTHANVVGLGSSVPEFYNFILPKKIPGNGVYTCKIQAHVLEIVGERKKSQDAAIGLIGAALGVMVGWILGILFPPPKKKEVAQ